MGIGFVIVPRDNNINEGIQSVRSIIPRAWFDEKKCEAGIKALEGYRKKFDPKNKIYANAPLHDWASHGADAFRTAARAIEGNLERKVKLQPLRTKFRRRDGRVI